MATRKKKAAAAEAIGLKQKSLLFFFSKPSAQVLSRPSPPAEENSHSSTRESSCSSYQQDNGDSLRWSQLLTGWSSASGRVPNDVDEDDVNGVVDDDDDEKNDERESRFSLRVCKKRRSYTSRQCSCSPSQNDGKRFHSEMGSSYVCQCPHSPSRNDGQKLHTEMGSIEASVKCFQIPEAQKLSLAVSPYKTPNDEAFLPQSPPQYDGKSLHAQHILGEPFLTCPNAADVQKPIPPSVLCNDELLQLHFPSINNDKVFCRDTKSDEASPAVSPKMTSDVEHTGARVVAEEAAAAFDVDLDIQEAELPANVCRTVKAGLSHSVEVNCSYDNRELKLESTDSHGYDRLEMVETHENKVNYGHSGLLTVSDCSEHANLGMSNAEFASRSSLATEECGAIMGVNASMGFCKLKRGSGHRVSAPEEFSEAPITEYEREREENILKNQHFLQKLGISSTAFIISKESSNRPSNKPRGKAICKVKPPPLPLRRSRRLLQDAAEAQTQTDNEAVEAIDHEGTRDEEAFFYDDSSVLRYTCEGGVIDSASYPCHGFTPGANSIVGFQPLDGALQDAYLTRIYTMSASYVSQSQRILLAAGGHQGQIAVFGTSCLNEDDKKKGIVTSTAIGNDVAQDLGSLLSWKGSSGWISGVKFLSSQSRESANLLLSSANDGNLVLWDINKQQKVQHSSTRLAGLPPLKVTEARGVHSNGIFSMHEFSGCVVTASKDSTVGYSKITNQEIITERSILGHHSGAIRGVNFRNASVIADCGSDGLICILDLRMAEPCTLTIDTADATGVNVVEWCPSQEHLLLSASKDPQISLHDTRNVKEPLYRLSGHIDPKVRRCSQIYRPTFVAQGLAIASPGQGSKALSLYSVRTGKAISRGHLGYDATMVMWSSNGDDSASVLWVASRHISWLLPVWQT